MLQAIFRSKCIICPVLEGAKGRKLTRMVKCNIIQPPIWVRMTNSSLIFITPRLWPRLMASLSLQAMVFFHQQMRWFFGRPRNENAAGPMMFDPQVIREIRRLWDREIGPPSGRRSNVFPRPVIQDGPITSWWHRETRYGGWVAMKLKQPWLPWLTSFMALKSVETYCSYLLVYYDNMVIIHILYGNHSSSQLLNRFQARIDTFVHLPCRSPSRNATT